VFRPQVDHLQDSARHKNKIKFAKSIMVRLRSQSFVKDTCLTRKIAASLWMLIMMQSLQLRTGSRGGLLLTRQWTILYNDQPMHS